MNIGECTFPGSVQATKAFSPLILCANPSAIKKASTRYAIGGVELGENKVDYQGMSLAELSEQDWNKFIDYNIQDVNLLVRLEQKLQYIPLLRMLSYVGLTNLEGAMGTIQVINGALCIRARKRGEIISTFVRNDGEGKNPGAYVETL